MDRLIYSALDGVSEFALPRMQLNNEIANMSTTGFKRSFKSASAAVKISGPGFDTRFKPSGDPKDRISLAQGPVMFTGNNTDIAMNNNTVLGVVGSNNELAYTRRGDLKVNSTGLLETGSGQAVRGENGTIAVPAGYQMNITQDGSIYAINPTEPSNAPPVLVGRLMLRDAGETHLERRADGLFEPMGARAGPPRAREITNGKQPPSVTPQSLEGSNVSAYESMVRLLEMNRSFEANLKSIKEAKDMDVSGATMLKVA